MTRSIALLALTLGACGSSDTRASRLSLLDQIAKKCHLPVSTFKLVGLDELHFQPPSDAKYDDVDCALSELKKSPFPMKMGFIGNEEYSEGNSQ